MTPPSRDGELVELEGGRVGVRFERRLAYPPERVWRAITEREELAKWFPAIIEGEFEEGAELRFPFPNGEAPTDTGTVTECEPPRLLSYTWGDNELRFELEADGDGCRLHFSHSQPREDAAKTAAGWEVCFANLEAALAGEGPAEFPDGHWSELHEGYAEDFGVSPEPGRQALRERQGS
jgi:uncharacterized protein YndB with AHSA1/START domain